LPAMAMSWRTGIGSTVTSPGSTFLSSLRS
jgi:hypothetical protein